MDSAISLLDDHTDQATKQLLQHVVDKKKKFDKIKHTHILSVWASMTSASLFLLYVYVFIVFPYSYSFFTMFSMFADRFYHMFFLVTVFGLYGYMMILKQKRDKAEKEFHELRKEIIHKSKDLWQQEKEWKSRHKVFEMMKKRYDINLYNENK
jgi:hypothetical protein